MAGSTCARRNGACGRLIFKPRRYGPQVVTVHAKDARLEEFKASPQVVRRILIVTDTWAPQVNGVVRTLEMTGRELSKLGHVVRFATPENEVTLPLPTYPEIRLALHPRRGLAQEFERFEPDAVHIATEGPMGLAARRLCLEKGLKFTTAFHTRFPEYVNARFPFVPESAVFAALRAFHAPAQATMVSTPSLQQEFARHGFGKLGLWPRGVDVERFKPGRKHGMVGMGLAHPRPLFLYVGRLAVEKNVKAFLELDLPGSKVVVGEGPQRAELQSRYPNAHYLGSRTGEELAQIYDAADVLVFPSRTDTYGLVLLEALACGVPVAAFPVAGPKDVITAPEVGALDEDLGRACHRALGLSPLAARLFALQHSWQGSTTRFLENLALRGKE